MKREVYSLDVSWMKMDCLKLRISTTGLNTTTGLLFSVLARREVVKTWKGYTRSWIVHSLYSIVGGQCRNLLSDNWSLKQALGWRFDNLISWDWSPGLNGREQVEYPESGFYAKNRRIK